MLTWKLTDLYCNTVGAFDQRIPGSNIIKPILQQGRATLVVSIEEELAHMVQPLKTALYVEMNGRPYFHGPCLDPVFSGSGGQVTIPAVDAGEWGARGFHHAVAERTMEQAEIMWQSIATRLVDLDPDTGIHLARIIRGFIMPTGIVRTHKAEAGTNCWQPLLDMSTLSSGPEFELEPLPPDALYDRNNADAMSACAAWARLNVSSRIGQDRIGEILFEYGFGQDNCGDFSFSPTGSQVKNYENAYGQTQGTDPQPHGFSENPGLRQSYGTWEGWDSPSFTTDEGCKAYAQQQVAAYASPVQNFTVVPAMEWMRREGGSPYGYPPVFNEDYFLGDTVSAEALLGPKRYPVEGRIVQTTVTEVDPALNMKVELACVPTVSAGGYT